MKRWKYITDLINEKAAMEVYECPLCGYYIGLDSSHQDQVNSMDMFNCPGCYKTLSFENVAIHEKL